MTALEDLGLVERASARWPEDSDGRGLGRVPGFVGSRMVPLVVGVAELCLARARRSPGASGEPDNTGILLVTRRGDLENGISVARAIDQGARVSPLAFFQSVPNSVLGHLTQRWGLGGPVLCTSPSGDGHEEALRVSAELILDGEADEMLAIDAEQACLEGEEDTARARLLAPAADRSPGSSGR